MPAHETVDGVPQVLSRPGDFPAPHGGPPQPDPDQDHPMTTLVHEALQARVTAWKAEHPGQQYPVHQYARLFDATQQIASLETGYNAHDLLDIELTDDEDLALRHQVRHLLRAAGNQP